MNICAYSFILELESCPQTPPLERPFNLDTSLRLGLAARTGIPSKQMQSAAPAKKGFKKLWFG